MYAQILSMHLVFWHWTENYDHNLNETSNCIFIHSSSTQPTYWKLCFFITRPVTFSICRLSLRRDYVFPLKISIQ